MIFGIIALSQIKKNGQKGRGLAIGGMVATAVWILLVALFVVIGILAADGDDDTNQSARSDDRVAEDQHEGSSNGDDNGTDNGGDTTTAPEDIDVLSLSVGDCLSDLSGSMFATLPVVPCSEPHEGEVYALFDVSLDGITYPGEDAIIDEAEQGCDSRLQNYAPSAYRDSGVEIFYLYPSEDTWSFGDREVVCITYYPDGPRTGSIADEPLAALERHFAAPAQPTSSAWPTCRICVDRVPWVGGTGGRWGPSPAECAAAREGGTRCGPYGSSPSPRTVKRWYSPTRWAACWPCPRTTDSRRCCAPTRPPCLRRRAPGRRKSRLARAPRHPGPHPRRRICR